MPSKPTHFLAFSLREKGRMDEALRVLAEAGTSRRAALMAYWAERDDLAFDSLGRWCDSEQIKPGCRSRGLVRLLADSPRFPTRPEFQEMLDEVGLPWRKSYRAREAGL